MMTPLLLSAVVFSAAPDTRLLAPEVSAGVGVLGTGYSQGSVRFGDAHLAPVVTGRYLFGGFTVEAGVLLAAPLAASTTASSVTGSLGLGWTGKKWNLTLGAALQWTAQTAPALQLVPQLRVSYDFGRVGATLGVFDQLGLVPAHLSGFTRLGAARVSLGYVAPLGVLAGVDVPLTAGLGVRVTGFVFKLFQSEYAMLTLALTFDGGAR